MRVGSSIASFVVGVARVRELEVRLRGVNAALEEEKEGSWAYQLAQTQAVVRRQLDRLDGSLFDFRAVGNAQIVVGRHIDQVLNPARLAVTNVHASFGRTLKRLRIKVRMQWRDCDHLLIMSCSEMRMTAHLKF